jgi:hypothetical protein
VETIYNYLDNMFASLPKTAEVMNVKNEIKNNMEDKYHELKQNGKSENEAIGIVISEFGNIEELISEYNINISNDEETLPNVTLEEANDYIQLNKKASFLVSIGVSLCILGAAIMVLLVQLGEDKIIFKGLSENLRSSIPVVIALVFCIVPAVAIFISSGFKLSKYKFIDTGDFSITSSTKQILKSNSMEFPKHNVITVIGVCLCVLSPVSIFVGTMVNEASGSTYGVVGTLAVVMIAVFLFINNGAYHEAYKKLLKKDEYSEKNKKENKVIGAVAAVVWPLATCAFLVAGLVYHLWNICWIVFPITGILFGAFCGAYNSIKENSASK